MNLGTRWLVDIASARKVSGVASSPKSLYERHTVRVAISGMIGALYATLVIVFAPFAFGPAQIRIADCLMPLAFIFGYPGAIGLAIGCLVGNYYGFSTGFSGTLDVIVGPVANLIAAILGYKLYELFANRGKNGIAWIQIAILVENIIVTLMVGSYMPIYIPLADTYAVSALLWYIGLFIGSLISMNAVGYSIYKMTYAGIL